MERGEAKKLTFHGCLSLISFFFHPCMVLLLKLFCQTGFLKQLNPTEKVDHKAVFLKKNSFNGEAKLCQTGLYNNYIQ